VVSPGAGTPTGTVDFKSGTTDLGDGTFSGGVATLQTSSLPVGANAITANYSGDTNFLASTAPAVNQQVNLGAVTVSLSASNTNPFGFQPVTLTSIVTSVAGNGTPTGTVTFLTASGINLGSSTLSNGLATLTLPSVPVGKASVTAVYSGNTNFASTTSRAVTVVVGSPSELFVNQVFLDTIGSPAGFGEAYWVALLNGGYAPKLVARLILQSPQARTQAVENVYQEFLNRPATSAELKQTLGSLNSSTTLLVHVLSSNEYYKFQGGGTIDGFLTALGTDFFGMPFSATEQAHLAGLLKSGVPRSQVVRDVITSPRGVASEINSFFEKILERPADRKGVAQFSPYIEKGQVVPVMVALFASEEFTKKFVDIV
jgi:hypothetical protein